MVESTTEEPTPESTSSTEEPEEEPEEETGEEDLTESPPSHPGDFDAMVAAKVSELGIRGAAVAFFDASTMKEPITRGYGKVSAGGSSPAVTADTAFMLASVSKPFAAAAVAVLVDRGLLPSLDADICGAVPNCRNPHFPTVPITWRWILTHRSSMVTGLPEAEGENGDPVSPTYGPSGGYTIDAPAAGNPTCPLKGVSDFYRDLLGDPADNPTTTVGAGINDNDNRKPLNWARLAEDSMGGMWSRKHPPGTNNDYSNAAYGYLPALVESVAGVPFAEFCSWNIFAPLGMAHTAWFREDLPEGTPEAVPNEREESGNGWVDVGHYCFIDYASGSLRTTANDLARFGTAMVNNLGAPALWSAETGREIVSCQEGGGDGDSRPPEDCEFGYGWGVLGNPKKGTTGEDWLEGPFRAFDWTDGILHAGAEAGSQTNMIILPKAGVYVGVLTNTDRNPETAAEELTGFVMEAHLGNIASGTGGSRVVGGGGIGSGGFLLAGRHPAPLWAVIIACLSSSLWLFR